MMPIWFTYVSPSRRAARNNRRPSRPCRLHLQALDDRLAPATLDLSAGVLTFAGADVTNSLTFTRAADRYTFSDPLDPIALGPGALAAGYTASGGGATASGPSAPVSSLALNLGAGANTVTLGPFDTEIVPLAVAGGGDAGSTVTVAAGGTGLTTTGDVSITGFQAVTLNNRVTAVGGTLTITSQSPLSLTNPVNATTVRLSAAGGVSQTAAGLISATTLGVRNAGAGAITLGADNVVGTFAARNDAAGGAVAFQSAAAVQLVVGSAPGGGGFVATDGITTAAGDVTLRAVAVSVAQPITAAGATVRLSAAAGITETAAAVVAAALGLEVTGSVPATITVNHADVGTLAAVSPTGTLSFVNVGALTIGTVTAQAPLFGGADGLTSAGVLLQTMNGDLTVNRPVTGVRGGFNGLRLTAFGDESLFTNASSISSRGIPILLTANRMALAGGRVDSDAIVSLHMAAVDRVLDFAGMADPAGRMTLSAAELNTVTAPELNIVNFGDITVSAPITLTSTPRLALTNLIGAILDNTPTEQADLIVPNLQLTSSRGRIGNSAADPLDVDVAMLSANSTGFGNNDIFLRDTAGGVAVGVVNAGGGNVLLQSDGNSLTAVAPNDGGAEVIGNVVTLVATGPSNGSTGQIGSVTTAAQFFEVNAVTLNASTNNSALYVSDIAGGVAVGTVNAGSQTVTLRVVGGAMTSAAVDGVADVIGGSAVLTGTRTGPTGPASSLGTSAASPLEVDVVTLQANTQGGGIHIRDTAGGLTVQSATADGPINLEAAGAAATLTVTSVEAPGNTVSLRAAGAINGTLGGTADVTAQSLALRAGAGIGVPSPLEIAVTNLAFQNAANAVAIRYVGALTIAPVDGLAGATNLGTTTTLTAVAPPTVTAVGVNGGAAQRSMVTSIQVTFSAPVAVAPGAFTLTYLGGPAGVLGSAVGGFTVTTATVGGVTVATLSGFAGTDTLGGSLIDGRYRLTVGRTRVTDVGVAMAGDFTFADSGTATGNQLYRLFGDANGDRAVNGADFTLFRAAFGAALGSPNFNAAFDVNGDGVIDGTDFAAFRANFGRSI